MTFYADSGDFSNASEFEVFELTEGLDFVFTFQSNQNALLGSFTKTFTVTANLNGSSDSITFTINVIDPCTIVEFTVNPAIVPAVVTYQYNTDSPAQLVQLVDPVNQVTFNYP